MNEQPYRGNSDGELADFWSGLIDDGCDMRHVRKMLDRIEKERVNATAAAARVFYNGDALKPLSLVDLADQLSELRGKALTLELAIIGACKFSKIELCGDALEQLADDVVNGMARFENAFFAELRKIPQSEPGLKEAQKNCSM